MLIMPGITPEADFYIEPDLKNNRVRLRASDDRLLAVIDMSGPEGVMIMTATIAGLGVIAPDVKVYDLYTRQYVTDAPVESNDADAAQPANPDDDRG
jgi:hypothetical protein